MDRKNIAKTIVYNDPLICQRYGNSQPWQFDFIHTFRVGDSTPFGTRFVVCPSSVNTIRHTKSNRLDHLDTLGGCPRTACPQ